MKSRIWRSALLILMILALVLSSFVSCKRKKVDDPTLAPDYAPPHEEQGAEDIGDGDGSKIDAPEGGGAAGMTYEDKMTVDLSDKKVTLRFDNASRSVSNVVLQVIIQDRVIVETGVITPGKRVTTVNLKEGAETLLQPGVYANNAKMVVNFYDPETNEKSAVKTEIPVTVTVQN